MLTLNYELELKPDRTVTFKLPETILPGRHKVVLIIEETISASEHEFMGVLEKTRGSWQQGDGLAWQLRLRDEWDKR